MRAHTLSIRQADFKQKRLDCAILLYKRALEFGPATEQQVVIRSNLSLVHATMKNGAAALEEADAALALDANNAKGHFRRGNALVLLNRIPESHSALERAAELDKMCVASRVKGNRRRRTIVAVCPIP